MVNALANPAVYDTRKIDPATKHSPPINQPIFWTRKGATRAGQPDTA
jgi:hypothetical protein